MIDTKLKAFIINTLRRASFRHKPRGEAKKRFKVKVGEFSTGRAKYGYRCIDCEEVFKSKEIKMDHIDAVVDPIHGFTGFDDYVERMFCDEDGFASLCPADHDKKTAIEKDYRVKFRKLLKENKRDRELENEYYKFIDKYKKLLDKYPKV